MVLYIWTRRQRSVWKSGHTVQYMQAKEHQGYKTETLEGRTRYQSTYLYPTNQIATKCQLLQKESKITCLALLLGRLFHHGSPLSIDGKYDVVRGNCHSARPLCNNLRSHKPACHYAASIDEDEASPLQDTLIASGVSPITYFYPFQRPSFVFPSFHMVLDVVQRTGRGTQGWHTLERRFGSGRLGRNG